MGGYGTNVAAAGTGAPVPLIAMGLLLARRLGRLVPGAGLEPALTLR